MNMNMIAMKLSVTAPESTSSIKLSRKQICYRRNVDRFLKKTLESIRLCAACLCTVCMHVCILVGAQCE